jgi:sarcosine oxidase subunit gamma
MSPDEYLLILPYAEVGGDGGAGQGSAGEHHLAVDVSDARAVFRVEGDKADQVLSKLRPSTLPRWRRASCAAVAAAMWAQDGGFRSGGRRDAFWPNRVASLPEAVVR